MGSKTLVISRGFKKNGGGDGNKEAHFYKPLKLLENLVKSNV